jgi:hypothetical protein
MLRPSAMITADREPLKRPADLRFARHFMEMAGAMLVGMVVLGRLESLLASAVGHPDALAGATVSALSMAANMTAAVVVWMRLRGHRLLRIVEMVAGMNVGFLAMAPQWIGATSHHTPMLAAHDLMFLGMLVAMLGRREHYSGSNRNDVRRQS